METTVGQLLTEAAKDFGALPAVRFEETDLSFAELSTAAREVAAALEGGGERRSGGCSLRTRGSRIPPPSAGPTRSGKIVLQVRPARGVEQTEAGVRELCLARLATYKQPSTVQVVR